MTSRAEDQIALVVPSCDRYADLWPSVFQALQTFWPDRSLTAYLVSNTSGIDVPEVKNIRVGVDESWSDNLLRALPHVHRDFVLLLLDDFVLTDFVPSSALLRVLEWIVKVSPNYVRLTPTPAPNRRFNDLVGEVSKGAVYRTSTIFPVWKKQVLESLLKRGESAWEFEVFGAVRSDMYGDFYAVWKPYFSAVNCVIKGKWEPGAVGKVQASGISLNLGSRPIMTQRERIVHLLKLQRSHLFGLLPAGIRRRAKHYLLRGRYVYKSLC